MRRLLWLLVFFSIMGITLPTQADDSAEKSFRKYKKMRRVLDPNVQITPVTGINAMSFQENTVSVNGQSQRYASEAENGTDIGILLDYNTSFYGIALQSGFVVSRYISGFNAVLDNRRSELRYEDTYLNLPFAFKVYPFSRAGQGFYAKAGVNVGILLNSQENRSQTNLATNETTQEQIDNTNRKQDLDAQALVGAGINIRLTNRMGLVLEGNYHHGLVDTAINSSGSDQIPEFKTQGYSGLLGLSFLL